MHEVKGLIMEFATGFYFYIPVFIILYCIRLRKLPLGQQVLNTLLFFYLCIVIDLTQFPLPATRAAVEYTMQRVGPFNHSSYNLMPFFVQDLNLLLQDNKLALNVIMTIPFGFLVGLKTRRMRKTLFFGACFTVALELTQLLTRYFQMSYRIFDVDDLILNFMGVAVGYGIYFVFRSGYHYIRKITTNQRE